MLVFNRPGFLKRFRYVKNIHYNIETNCINNAISFKNRK